MPCQPRFGEPPWSWTDYQDCHGVHLLGGSPHKHAEIARYYVNIRSIDTAVPVRSAQFGSVWTEEKWIEQDRGYYQSIKQSFANITEFWNPGQSFSVEQSLRIQLPDSKYDTCGYPEGDLIHPNEKRPFPGREYYLTKTQ